MRSYCMKVSLKSNEGDLITHRQGHTETQGQEMQWQSLEAEISYVFMSREALEAGRGKEDFSLRAFRGSVTLLIV